MKLQREISRSEMRMAIDEWIFNERDREILKLRLLDGLTYERIAERMDMSDRQIKRIVYRTEDILFRHLS